jgi:hypothetical protein
MDEHARIARMAVGAHMPVRKTPDPTGHNSTQSPIVRARYLYERGMRQRERERERANAQDLNLSYKRQKHVANQKTVRIN